MTVIETLFLGLIQGLTEFLPVSSSGHLVIFQNILGFKEPELLLDSSLHMGTLLAVCIYFRSDIKEIISDLWQRDFKAEGTTLAVWVVIASVPTALIGLFLQTQIEKIFASVQTVGAMLIATGFIVALPRLSRSRDAYKQMWLLTALAIGTAQGLAIIPGISRSGATIACGLLCGLEREHAARFSFLLSIPAIVGALALQMNIADVARVGFASLVVGFGTSALVGLMALKLLMGIVKKGHLSYFAPYCWAGGLVVVIFAR